MVHHLVLAGNVTLNPVYNGRLSEITTFRYPLNTGLSDSLFAVQHSEG